MAEKEYIEREAFIDAMYGDYRDIELAQNFPAADVVEVRDGEWRDDADKIDKHFHRHDFFCKECNTRADYFIGGEGNWWCSYAPDYCPKCGAKMDGGVNDAAD